VCDPGLAGTPPSYSIELIAQGLGPVSGHLTDVTLSASRGILVAEQRGTIQTIAGNVLFTLAVPQTEFGGVFGIVTPFKLAVAGDTLFISSAGEFVHESMYRMTLGGPRVVRVSGLGGSGMPHTARLPGANSRMVYVSHAGLRLLGHRRRRDLRRGLLVRRLL